MVAAVRVDPQLKVSSCPKAKSALLVYGTVHDQCKVNLGSTRVHL